jgi:hypothetical protein
MRKTNGGSKRSDPNNPISKTKFFGVRRDIFVGFTDFASQPDNNPDGNLASLGTLLGVDASGFTPETVLKTSIWRTLPST